MKTNRVPESPELVTLRKLIQFSEQSLRDFDRQVEEGRERHTDILKRHEQNLRALEGTSSELNAVTRFADMLEGQKSRVQKDLGFLYGLVHPIRRCPTDILRDIFKWAVCMESKDTEWFKCATRISHVCRRWRGVSIDTPFLWKKIDISVGPSVMGIKEYGERTVQRLKNTPPSIVFRGLVGSVAEAYAIEYIRLDLYARIDYLHFELAGPTAYQRLVDGISRLPKGEIDHLHISAREINLYGLYTSMDAEPIIRRFPRARSMTLHRLWWRSPIATGAVNVFRNVVNLEISGPTFHSPLALLTRSFPHLETAYFKSISLNPHDTSNIFWPQIKTLRILAVKNIPWLHLRAPAITHVSIKQSEVTPNDNFMIFLSTHPSLQHLSIFDSGEFINSTLQGVDNLRSLATDVAMITSNPPILKSERLQELCLLHFSPDDIPFDSFEVALRAFLRPKGVDGTNSQSQTHITSKLLVPYEFPMVIEWEDDESTSSSIMELSVVRHWDSPDLFRSYSFT